MTRLFLALIIVASFAAPAQSQVLDRIEASVNSKIILLSDIMDFRRTSRLRAQLDPLFTGTPLARKKAATDREVLEFLINENIITAQFPVKDAEVEQEINTIQANNSIDRKGLKAAIREQGFSFEDYSTLIRISMSKRNLIDRDIRTKVFISDDDIKNFFYNQRRGKGSALKYKIKIIAIDPKNYKKATEGKKTIERALKEIRAGEAFEEVAKRMSDDPSARSGGDLGTLGLRDMSPMIRKQVKKLKVGQVSDVFGSSKSAYFILKLADIRSDLEGELKKLKNQIRNQLTAKEYQHQIELWLERKRQEAFIHRAGEPLLTKRK